MYWLYLVIFVGSVFVPDYLIRGHFGLPVRTTQELILFFLGLLGFAMFLAMEKRNAFHRQQWLKVQKANNQCSKDLTTSYSYIGETNRKLEILKGIMLGIPMSMKVTAEKERELLHSIIEAAHVLTKSNRIILRFKNEHFGVVKEIKSNEKVAFNYSLEQEATFEDGAVYMENEEYAIFTSQRYFDGTRAHLIILKDVSHRNIEDVEIMKTLAAYGLFMYIYCRSARKKLGLKTAGKHH